MFFSKWVESSAKLILRGSLSHTNGVLRVFPSDQDVLGDLKKTCGYVLLGSLGSCGMIGCWEDCYESSNP